MWPWRRCAVCRAVGGFNGEVDSEERGGSESVDSATDLGDGLTRSAPSPGSCALDAGGEACARACVNSTHTPGRQVPGCKCSIVCSEMEEAEASRRASALL